MINRAMVRPRRVERCVWAFTGVIKEKLKHLVEEWCDGFRGRPACTSIRGWRCDDKTNIFGALDDMDNDDDGTSASSSILSRSSTLLISPSGGQRA